MKDTDVLRMELTHDSFGDHSKIDMSGSPNLVLGLITRAEFELSKLKAQVFKDLEKNTTEQQAHSEG